MTRSASLISLKKAYQEFLQGKNPNIQCLNVELTNFCNLKCRYCILDNSRAKGFMDIRILEKIISEINNQLVSVKNIALHDAGESLLHPDLGEFLELLALSKHTNPSFPKISIQTNGVLMTPLIRKIILKSNALDFVSFSIDGGNKKDFEHLRKGAIWEKVIKNIDDFISLNNKLGKKVATGMTSISLGKPQYSPEFKKLVKKLDSFQSIVPHDWDGSKKFKDLKIKKESKKSFCHFIFNSLAIKWDGKVVACCNDLNGRIIIGDFIKQSIKEIYFGPLRSAILLNMAKGQRQENALCQNCTM